MQTSEDGPQVVAGGRLGVRVEQRGRRGGCAGEALRPLVRPGERHHFLEELQDHPEGQVPLVLAARSAEHPSVRAPQPALGDAQQARLAQPVAALQDHDRPPAGPGRLQSGLEHVELGLPFQQESREPGLPRA